MNPPRRAGTPGTRVFGLTAAIALAGVGTWVLTRSRRPAVVKRRPNMPALAGGRGCRIDRAVTVMRSADELYAQWRDLARLPDLMPHLESVTPLDETRSRWVTRGPADVRLTWDAELVADEPGRLIAWRSLPGAEVENAGSIRFTPTAGGRHGTEVKVLLSYAAPAGRLGSAVATILCRSGDRRVREDLRRFKQRMETNEVATNGRLSAVESARRARSI
jgi:uncharacterized membrane protein